jgi:hypothetical protein
MAESYVIQRAAGDFRIGDLVCSTADPQEGARAVMPSRIEAWLQTGHIVPAPEKPIEKPARRRAEREPIDG